MRFSLLTMLGGVLATAFVLAYVTYERRPEIGEWLCHCDDGNLCIYAVNAAKQNVHFENGTFFLTMLCETSGITWPEDLNDNTPFLELSLPFRSDPTEKIKPGAVFPVIQYSEVHYNLTNIYVDGVHMPFENARVIINNIKDGNIDATLIGEDGGGTCRTVKIRAIFVLDKSLTRGFS